MNILSFNEDFKKPAFPDEDILSVFRQTPEKIMVIRHGMSENEISDVVSDKIIEVVKEQFEATKIQWQARGKDSVI